MTRVTQRPFLPTCSAQVQEAEKQRAKWVEEIQARLEHFEEVRQSIDKYREFNDALSAELKAVKKERTTLAAALTDKVSIACLRRFHSGDSSCLFDFRCNYFHCSFASCSPSHIRTAPRQDRHFSFPPSLTHSPPLCYRLSLLFSAHADPLPELCASLPTFAHFVSSEQ